MRILDYFKPSTDKNIVCLGRFDGFHLGHKTLLYKGAEIRNNLHDGTKLAVFLFQRYPYTYGAQSILTFRETIDKLKGEPVDNVIVAPETPEFYAIERKNFLDTIKQNFNPVAIICGEDYTFGRDRLGDKNYLKDYCIENGIDFYCMPLFKKGGEKVSSTRIKRLLLEGDVRTANELLGDNYFIRGEVSRGRGVGRKIGFPTMNIEIPPEKAPLKKGVYATLACFGGVKHSSITNYGSAPTFCNDKVLIETHVTDGNCDMYGLDVTIEFERFLREDKKFDTVEDLIEQLKKDVLMV